MLYMNEYLKNLFLDLFVLDVVLYKSEKQVWDKEEDWNINITGGDQVQIG